MRSVAGKPPLSTYIFAICTPLCFYFTGMKIQYISWSGSQTCPVGFVFIWTCISYLRCDWYVLQLYKACTDVVCHWQHCWHHPMVPPVWRYPLVFRDAILVLGQVSLSYRSSHINFPVGSNEYVTVVLTCFNVYAFRFVGSCRVQCETSHQGMAEDPKKDMICLSRTIH